MRMNRLVEKMFMQTHIQKLYRDTLIIHLYDRDFIIQKEISVLCWNTRAHKKKGRRCLCVCISDRLCVSM
jgi:hypothetical protein